MDLGAIMLSEEVEIQILYNFTYMWNLKNKTNEQIVVDKENQQVVARGEEGSARKEAGEID